MKNNKYTLVLFAILIFNIACSLPLRAINDGSRYAASSKLATGNWIKLKVTDNAIYQLTYDDIKRMGISDPAKVKLYGSGGWKLDEDFTKPYVDDLQEIAVWVNKGSDNVFGSGDYLLFYGRGTVKWTFNTSTRIFEHENNPYSTYGAYFMTEGETGPKEMESESSVAQTSITFSTFDDYVLHEQEQVTIANTGRELFGESFTTQNTQTFGFDVPGITSDDASVSLSFAARVASSTPISLTINDQLVVSGYVNSYNPSDANSSYVKARMFNATGKWTGQKSENTSMKVNFTGVNQLTAYLNYIRLNAKRNLQVYGAYTFFRNKDSRNIASQYSISSATGNCVVFDLTDYFDAKKVDATLSGSQLTFGAQSGNEIREYAVVDVTKKFPVPELIGGVANQNLHARPQTEMVILAPKAFLPQATLLAEEHHTRSGLDVTVVQADLIFNEFSSGVPDATAYRRFMKMFYDRAASESEKPKYLLFFGDGVFDNRFLTSGVSNMQRDNYLVTYQVAESVDETRSYGTDDYFGFLDDNEGTDIGADMVDLGIGRFPVSSPEQATNAVNKVIGYMANKQLGSWKNTVIFTSDDIDYDRTSFFEFATQADELADSIQTYYPEYMIKKAYQDAFKQITTDGKKTYPDAKNKLMTNLKNGCFLLNYTGHGSTTAWTSEGLLSIKDVNQMSFANLPLWITATCDFGWFDGVNNSAGEAAFQNKKSGAIALFTTSRVVYSTPNQVINKRLISNLFARDNQGKRMRLGDVLRKSKNKLGSDTNKLNYVLLGDPALALNFPESKVKLETVNGVPVAEGKVFEFKALEKVTLTGKITDIQGNIASDFKGNIRTTIFDSKQELSSVRASSSGGYFTFEDYPNTVFIGNNAVENGSFSVTFTVPLDISYSDQKGKLNLYAYDEAGGKDAQGYFLDYVLNGTSVEPDDSEGPEIQAMYLNSTSFKSGDEVNETPYFVAQVYDEDGINMTGSSLGHDITITIDNSTTLTYTLNQYYEPSADVSGQGLVQFPIPALEAGQHTLVFKVWDLVNNSTTDSLTFHVVKGLKPKLYDITAASNPAKVNTWFLLSHDRPDSQIEVEIKVYDLTGRPLWTYRESGSSEWLKNYPVEWNLCTDGGMRLKPGVYIYRGAISTQGSKEATEAKKIIIMGQ